MLDAFLERMACRAFDDGAADCGLSLADWVMVARGCVDPAAHLRGRYSTPLGRERLLRRLGGMEAVVAGCAAHAGLNEAAEPQRGDVGVIEHGERQYGAICLGERWALQGDGLVTLVPDRVVRAWRV
ncbi:hypothetical protein ABIB58_002875 [Brevundimonas sp. UYEF29]|uniref:DUF6950 family protein n=1 Tax=Brevundimonas sp. UYEF29 TaxID=3156346 RepID=UPI00339AB317